MSTVDDPKSPFRIGVIHDLACGVIEKHSTRQSRQESTVIVPSNPAIITVILVWYRVIVEQTAFDFLGLGDLSMQIAFFVGRDSLFCQPIHLYSVVATVTMGEFSKPQDYH